MSKLLRMHLNKLKSRLEYNQMTKL